MNASATIGLDVVAGLDDDRRCRVMPALSGSSSAAAGGDATEATEIDELSFACESDSVAGTRRAHAQVGRYLCNYASQTASSSLGLRTKMSSGDDIRPWRETIHVADM